MPLFISNKKLNKKIQASTIKEIQASLEGQLSKLELESLLTGQSFTSSIAGTENSYQTYDSQVRATYDKYNGKADFGVSQTRAVVDLRSSMIAGEGISIATEDEKLGEWIDTLLTNNKMLNGQDLFKVVKSTEMTGQSILSLETIKPEKGSTEDPTILIKRLAYKIDAPFRVKYKNNGLFCESEIAGVEVKQGKNWIAVKMDEYVYILTGGDDITEYGPTTRVGIVLTDIENYDRAIKDMRRNNHILARITPSFEVGSESDAKTLITRLKQMKWKIGMAFVGKAKFKYESPGQGAHLNLETEMKATLKNISATTGVPVHWLGHVDLMSNRSTADSLYELIKQATIMERNIIERSMYELILKAQALYIDAGGDLKLNKDFQVKIPLLDFSSFLERVKALQIARADGAISMDDYMNMLPGIDPYKTKKALGAEDRSNSEDLLNKSKQFTRDKQLLESSEED